MDERSKRILLEQGMNRMVRELGRRGMNPLAGEGWSVPTDIYETDDEFVVCLELAGVEPAAMQVVVEENRLSVSGERKYNFPQQARRVHQLEIERGPFEKTFSFSWPIDVEAAGTEYRHGFLLIKLPKRRRKVQVPVVAG